jgi:membrane protease YdiL (CAAX protease family)
LNEFASEPPSESPIASPQPSALRRVFIGADGLRAGWSLLTFIALLAAILFCAHFILHKIHPGHHDATSAFTLRFALLSEGIPLLATLLVTWIMSKIEHRPNSVYGLGGRSKVSHFIAGLAWGVALLSLLVLILWKTGLLVIDSRLLFGADAFRHGAAWLVGFFVIGLLEEYLTRGYLLFTLARGIAGIYRWIFKTRLSATLGFWTAAIILSLLFGLGHVKNPGESPIGLLSAGLASMVFCLSLWRTGSLWWAIGLHTSWDWAQSFLYGVADSGTMIKSHLLATHPVGKPLMSGGATGPEGSIYCLLVLALIAVVIIVTLPRSLYPLPHHPALPETTPA